MIHLRSTFSVIFWQVLFFATCPLQGICMTLFIIWRFLVWLYLKTTQRKKFNGLLSLVDSFFEIKQITQNHTHFCLVIKTEQHFEEFFTRIKATIEEKSAHIFFKKLASIRKNCCGVDYIIKDEFKVDDIVKVLDVSSEQSKLIEKERLEDLISEYALQELPENNQRFLEIRVVNKKVKTCNSDYCYDKNTNYFAVLVKLQHSLTDGLHFIKFLGYLSDQSDFEVFNKIKKKKWIIFKLLMAIALYALNFVTKLARINTDSTNIFINKTLSHRNIFKFHVEDEDKYIPLIKSVRKKISNVTVSDIIITAVTASLSDFYNKRNVQESPSDNFYALIPVAFQSTDDFVLTNKFSWNQTLLPLAPIKRQSVLQKLETIARQNEAGKNNAEPEFMSLCQQLLTLLPPALKSFFMNKISCGSTLISIVPAFGKNVKLFGGEMVNFIGYAPPMPTSGIIFTLLTYNNRFQLAFSIDEAFVKTKKEAQEVMDGIFKHLLELDRAINDRKV